MATMTRVDVAALADGNERREAQRTTTMLTMQRPACEARRRRLRASAFYLGAAHWAAGGDGGAAAEAGDGTGGRRWRTVRKGGGSRGEAVEQERRPATTCGNTATGGARLGERKGKGRHEGSEYGLGKAKMWPRRRFWSGSGRGNGGIVGAIQRRFSGKWGDGDGRNFENIVRS
ncbi:hypothetical protein E2562_012518 [Oryza meyeriana var. granulata]|uniref:DUF834 domain-containing protein n=1 Tax=Oryza meyeriana var. granulata TaxID=110450 RepID=A0A6G1BWI7_9ORYZ|nr:hypothetical protein E2562_012518 [Oryza meyeriana var. granulata]